MNDRICTEPVRVGYLRYFILVLLDSRLLILDWYEGEIGCVTKWSRVKTQVMIPSGMAIMRTVTGPRGKVAKVAKVAPKVAREAVPALVALAKAKQKGEAAVATTGGVTDFKMYISKGAHGSPCPFALVVPISKVLKSGRRLMILFESFRTMFDVQPSIEVH